MQHVIAGRAVVRRYWIVRNGCSVRCWLAAKGGLEKELLDSQLAPVCSLVRFSEVHKSTPTESR